MSGILLFIFASCHPLRKSWHNCKWDTKRNFQLKLCSWRRKTLRPLQRILEVTKTNPKTDKLVDSIRIISVTIKQILLCAMLLWWDAGLLDLDLGSNPGHSYNYCVGFIKRCGMGPLLVLVSPCSRENVVVTCKIGSFLCSFDTLLQKNVIGFFFENQTSKWCSFEKKDYLWPTFHMF